MCLRARNAPEPTRVPDERSPSSAGNRVLLPQLFDGYIWRSRLIEAADLRVNFCIRHLPLCKDSSLAGALEWIADFKNPRIECRPIISMLSDMLWSRVSYRRLSYEKDGSS